MTEQKFKSEMRRAETMRGLADPMMAEYWAGYIRGLRRAYHGDKFGTAEEHEKWLSAANSRDESRKQRGRGYRDGLAFAADTESIAAEAVCEALSKMADELHENSDGFLSDLREDIEFTTDVGDALIPAYISDRFLWRDVEHEIEIFLQLAEFVEGSKYRLVYEAEIY